MCLKEWQRSIGENGNLRTTEEVDEEDGRNSRGA